MKARGRSQGAEVLRHGVHYRTWAPEAEQVCVVVLDSCGKRQRVIDLEREAGGYFNGLDHLGQPNDCYLYGFGGKEWPDPASRFNPEGVHGPAMVVSPHEYSWGDERWHTPSAAKLVIYELHIGTFTDEGTFRAAMHRLPHLRELGINAIEIMPVADFVGTRNWGYDGVSLYAPARCYGVPDDLRMLVDAAHAHGIAVILDVVYNHLGPSGNYLSAYSREYFNKDEKTAWGDAIDYRLLPVRRFFCENPVYWRREFHIDGFRLDATHAMPDSSEPHILAEISESIHALGGFVIAEDERHEERLLRSTKKGGLGMDACWADDFHHVVRVMLTGERESYYRGYRGTTEELCRTLTNGWLHTGTLSAESVPKQSRPERLVFCISNHDQVGNNAFGQRLNHLVTPAAYRAASALLCLAPFTPLIFMGQEWGSSNPFQFFTDYDGELGQRIAEGRRREFRDFKSFSDPAVRATIPDPQALETFRRSKLRWEELKRTPHTSVLALYRDCLRLRRKLLTARDQALFTWEASQVGEHQIALRFVSDSDKSYLLLIGLLGKSSCAIAEFLHGARTLWSSNDMRYSGENIPPFSEPEVRLVEEFR
jgi:maltooligosyltrehalose trehalohydrolase